MEERAGPPQELSTLVAHVAKTEAEAQVVAANLNAAGIPAYVESAALVDEYAMSQKLMNRMGVRVLVMSNRVDEAREFIADRPTISDDELDAQAMAAGEEMASSADHAVIEGMRRRGWRAVILLSPYLASGAVLFFALAVWCWSALFPLSIDLVGLVVLLVPIAGSLLVALAAWLLLRRR